MKISGIITSLKKRLTDFGSGVNNFAGNVVRQAPAMLQNYSNAYQKVSPFIPFAPQYSSPQKTQQNFQKVTQPIKTFAGNVKSELYNPSPTFSGFTKKLFGSPGAYVANRYIDPLTNIAPSAKMAFGKNKTLIQRGQGALGLAGGIATIFPDPIQDLAMPAYDLIKGAKAYQIQNQGKKLGTFEALKKGGIPALTLEKPAGLGDAITKNPTGQMVGNLAEFPLMMGLLGGKNAKRGEELIKQKGFTSLADKLPRFEISDRQAFLKVKNLGEKIKEGASRLGDIFEHEGLYTQYPQLKKLRVMFDNTMEKGNNGSFNPKTFTLNLNPKLSPGELRSTILHEVQHGLQDIEGFAKGGSPNQFTLSRQGNVDITNKIKNLSQEQEALNKIINSSPHELETNRQLSGFNGSIEQYKKKLINEIYNKKDEIKGLLNYKPSQIDKIKTYERLAGEIEARDVQFREPLSPQQRKYTTPYASQNIPLKDQIVRFGNEESASMKLTPEQLAAKKRLPGILLTTSKKTAGRDFNIKNEDAFIKGLEQDKLKRELGTYKPQRGSNVDQIPSMTNFDQDQMINQAKFRSTENKQAFDKLFAEWIGKRNASSTIGVQTGAKLNVPPNIKGDEVIKFMENPNAKVSGEAKQYSGKLRNEFNNLYDYANKSGIDIGYLKDYITHIWDRPQEEVAQLYKTLGQKFNFSKERKYPTYEEGIKMGLNPKFTNPAQLLSEYTKKLEKTKANIEFANQLKDQGFLSTLRGPGLVPITAEGFTAPRTRMSDGGYREGAYYAPPEVAKVINQVFSKQESSMSIPANISSKIQDITLSGGLPKTPINAWTFAQVTKEVMAGRVKSPLKAIWTSLSDTGSNKYFSDNAEFIKEQQLNNIPISTTFNTESLVKKGTIEGLFGKSIGEAWNKTVNEPTFKRFMPVLQTEFYKDAKQAALNAGKGSEEAIQIASQATKNFYGLTSTAKTAQQGQLGKDVLSTFAFAPRYRESMINFWLNNIKSLANPLALENRSNLKFMVGATLTALAYDKLNRHYNNGRSMLDNPKGKEDKLLIPLKDGTVLGVPYLSSIATMPRAIFREGKMIAQGDISGAIKDASQTYSSSMIRPLADVAANSDYFGKPITEENMTTGEKFGAIGKYLGTQYLSHPYLKELLDPRNQEDPMYQRLSRAMEAPFRFYTNKSIDTGYYYDAKDKAIKGLGDQEQQAFNAIPKSDSNDPNTRILKYQIYLTYPKVFEAKQQIELQTAQKTGKAIDPLYLVNYDTAKKYMRYEALPEGSQDRKDMTKAYPELVALFSIRSKYFDENPIPGTVQSSNKPIASAYVQTQMDAKNWKDPQVKAYLDANTAYNNQQREKLGLPPLAGYIQFTKKPKAKKIAFKKIKVKKPKKIAKLKIKMPKNTIKITKIPIKQPKRVAFKIKSIVSDLKKLS
jgi:hypothetical protein